MATSELQDERIEGRGVSTRVGWLTWAVAVVAVVATVIAATQVLPNRSSTTSLEPAASSIYTDDEQAVLRLVQRGVLPASVLEAEPFRTKALVARGVVPAAALERGTAVPAPLYCPDELALVAAVAAGVVPRAVLDGEPFRTKALINQGLIPRESVEPCR